jgi:PLP dependent protein
MSIAQRLQQLKSQIAATCTECGRDLNEVQLIVVSKNRTSIEIREVYAAGQRIFAENYLQEAITKIQQLQDLPLEWHFIGAIQSNKTKLIAETFDWVHSVDSLAIATRLNKQRLVTQSPLNVCIQVNISVEVSKSGVDVSEVLSFAQQIQQLPHLQLRGLMVIPQPTSDPNQQHAVFKAVAQLAAQLRQAGIAVDTLSMGMSDDFVAAIWEGATMLRIGTAVFGKRSK